jgi:hypothetical protein
MNSSQIELGPNDQRCDYCMKNIHHDGSCMDYKRNGCFLYEEDPRGKVIYSDNVKFCIPFGIEIPELSTPCDIFTVNKVDKTLVVTKIRKVSWSKKPLGINLIADIKYFSHENGVICKKPKLGLIHGGKK